jgi:hypothetical protein
MTRDGQMFSRVPANSFVFRDVHRWVIDIGEWQFGIKQVYASDGRVRSITTYVELGPISIGTALSPYAVLAIIVVGALLAVGGVAWLITKSGQKRDVTAAT